MSKPGFLDWVSTGACCADAMCLFLRTAVACAASSAVGAILSAL